MSKLLVTINPDIPMDIIPTTLEQDNEYLVEKIVDYKVDNFPIRYRKGPCLLFKVRWAFPHTKKNDSWEPYIL